MAYRTLALGVATALLDPIALSQTAIPPGESPAITLPRITQAEIDAGMFTFNEIRAHGLRMFATNFNKFDGYGDGPVNFIDPTSPGHRPTLQNNGTFLRVNGLDAQSCMECHSVGSSQSAPFRFAVGGVGGSNNNVLFKPLDIDVDDSDGNGYAAFSGRYINPPFLFGSGGIELLAKEMTADLQELAALAPTIPGVPIALNTKGVNFGSITWDPISGQLDTSAVEGVNPDLVVRPFGRKGEFSSVRKFDIDAMQFHFGMQPAEAVGNGVDGDDDGVVDEVLTGELSAMHVFNTNLEPPTVVPSPTLSVAALIFTSIGCADCHRIVLETESRVLNYSFPEEETDPSLNVFMSSDLSTPPTNFQPSASGGLRVICFSDLKRHDMGPGLAESFGSELDSHFITARLWGVADTAPYLHDGRALTLTDAILAHGGEAQAARDTFASMPDAAKIVLLEGLRSLRTPVNPAGDLVQ